MKRLLVAAVVVLVGMSTVGCSSIPLSVFPFTLKLDFEGTLDVESGKTEEERLQELMDTKAGKSYLQTVKDQEARRAEIEQKEVIIPHGFSQ